MSVLNNSIGLFTGNFNVSGDWNFSSGTAWTANAPTLNIANLASSVSLSIGNAACALSMTTTTINVASNGGVNITEATGTITLSATTSGQQVQIYGDSLNIVGTGTAAVVLQSNLGNLAINSLTGSVGLTAATDMFLTVTAGDLDIGTSTGNLNLSVSSGTLNLGTTTGDIDISAGNSSTTGDVNIGSAIGNINIYSTSVGGVGLGSNGSNVSCGPGGVAIGCDIGCGAQFDNTTGNVQFGTGVAGASMFFGSEAGTVSMEGLTSASIDTYSAGSGVVNVAATNAATAQIGSSTCAITENASTLSLTTAGAATISYGAASTIAGSLTMTGGSLLLEHTSIDIGPTSATSTVAIGRAALGTLDLIAVSTLISGSTTLTIDAGNLNFGISGTVSINSIPSESAATAAAITTTAPSTVQPSGWGTMIYNPSTHQVAYYTQV